MKKLILYDLDGTIVDTRKDIANAANHMITHFGGPAKLDEEIYQFVGRGIYPLIEGCLGTTDKSQVEQGLKIYRKRYTEHLLDYTKLYEGAEALLKFFSDRHQAVVTNKPDPYATDILKALGAHSYLFRVVAGNSGLPAKPDPASVRALMEETGVDSNETLFLGDSLIDLETAKNAGVDVILLSHGFTDRLVLESAKPVRIFDHFDQVRAFVKEKQW